MIISIPFHKPILHLFPRIAVIMGLIAGLTMATAKPTTAWALSFKKAPSDATKAPPNSIRPPAADALKTDCEPIRQRVVALNNKPVFVKAFTKPVKAYQIHRHRSCIKRISGQEWLYLKNVQIKGQPGQLPAVQVEQVSGQAFAPKQAKSSQTESSGAESSGTEFSSARPQAAPGAKSRPKKPLKTPYDFQIQSLPPGLPEERPSEEGLLDQQTDALK